MISLLLVPCFFTSAFAIVVEVFTDAACTVPIGNSSIYTAWAGVCNTAFTPDSGFAIGLDFCSSLRVTLSVFRDPQAGAAETWGGAISCAGPPNATVALAENVCTLVRPCPTCGAQYFRLVDTRCNAPAPTLILQHDRGEDMAGGVQGCQVPLAANAGQRFQTREVLLGTCNARTITRTPDSVPNSNGNCASALSACSRLDINALSVLPVQTLDGLDVTTFFADTCDQSELPVAWQSVPVQDKNSLFCRVQRSWNVGVLASYARHGLRVYSPQPYTTLLSESPTPSATPSQSPTASASASTARPLAPPAPLAAAFSRDEFVTVSTVVIVLLVVLGVGLAGLYAKVWAFQRQPPVARKEPQAVEMVNAIHSATRNRPASEA